MPQFEILLQSITYLKGVGPLRAEVLQKELGIFTYGDLLFHFPFRYYDRTKFYNIHDVNENSQFIQLKGILEDVDVAGDKRSRRMVATLRDNSGSIQLVWFKGIDWVKKTLKEGKEYIVFGKPTTFNNKFNIAHPEMELVDNETKVSFSGKQQPFYPSTEKLKLKGLDSIGIARIVQALMLQLTEHDIEETLPENILQHYRFPSRFKALQQIHLPSSEYDLAIATQRLKYEELFFIQLNILKLKQSRQQTQKGIIFKQLGELFNTFYSELLPFKLTNAQKKVLKEIRQDTLSGKQMNRLLQGDVGSGKTIVALICALIANDNEYQAALMVPTEILARQHFQSLKELTAKLNFRIELLTGSVKGKERKKLLEGLRAEKLIYSLALTH